MNLKEPIPIQNKNFQQIIQNYLFECPVCTYNTSKDVNGKRIEKGDKAYNYALKRVSRRGKSFQDRGLGGSGLVSLLAAMKRTTPEVRICTISGDDEITTPEVREYITTRKDNKVGTVAGYYYLIRNSFAHGCFEVSKIGRETFYSFENYTQSGKLKGKARLSERSLLKWIELINMSVDELRSVGKVENQ